MEGGKAMNRRAILCVLAIGGLLAVALLPVMPRRPSASAQEGKPLLIVYWEEDFQGPALEVGGSLPDLPTQVDAAGNPLDWNDRVRSVVVKSGTWRLYQHGRSNTKLDDTPLEDFDLGTKEKEAGWSCLVSATSKGPLELRNGAAGGFYPDISSIELVSEENLPDWSAPGLPGR
jgi:hypothetical protein